MEALGKHVRTFNRPRGYNEVPRWLQNAGATTVLSGTCLFTTHASLIATREVGGALMKPFGEWRLEIEIQSPCTPSVLARTSISHTRETLSKGLYLHHLLRSLITGVAIDSTPHVLSRQRFLELLKNHFGDVARGFPLARGNPRTTMSTEEFAREWLATVCTRMGLTVHAKTRYPMQPRPFDLTPQPRFADDTNSWA